MFAAAQLIDSCSDNYPGFSVPTKVKALAFAVDTIAFILLNVYFESSDPEVRFPQLSSSDQIISVFATVIFFADILALGIIGYKAVNARMAAYGGVVA